MLSRIGRCRSNGSRTRLLRHRRVKERFLAPPRPLPLTGTALRTLLGREEHQAVAAEMARFA